MKIAKNKTKNTMIAMFLMLTFAISLAMPIANAHTPSLTIPTYCYVAVTNSVIGVGQELGIVFWTNAVPPTASGAYGDRWSFYVDITRPDSSNETLGPFTSDSVGGSYTPYTPTQTGTYTLVARSANHTITGTPMPPGQSINTIQGAAYVNDTYTGSQSDPITFTVQDEAIQPWSETPLPTQYWARPINSANRGWYVLAGNWLAGSAQNVGPTTRFANGEGPESAHIMWVTPMWAGGIMDAYFDDTGYATSHYEGLEFKPPIILNGKLYYNVQSLPKEGWYCLDLYTGEVEYFHNTTGIAWGVSDLSSGSISGEALTFGQIYNYDSPNQHGGIPYLWSTPNTFIYGATPSPLSQKDWMMFDAYTGNYICRIKNVPSWVSYGFGHGLDGNAVYGKDGSILCYNIANYGTANAPNYYLQCWNTSRALSYRTFYVANSYWLWRPGLNVTYDGNNGYSLNSSIPAVQGSILAIREGQYVIGGTAGKNNGTYVQQGNLWALNLKPDSNGVITPTLLWNITFTPPTSSIPDIVTSSSAMGAGGIDGPKVDPEDGVFVFYSEMTRQWWGYSLETGQQLWGPTESEPAMNYYGVCSNIYQGMLLSTGYSGVLMAYDLQTGDVVWNYTASNVGFESAYGNYPLCIGCIADGKIYLVTGEHSPTQPLMRGSYLRCVNASNGVELWKTLNWACSSLAGVKIDLEGSTVVAADGYLVALNYYDNQIYCYGKGPSAITVTAPDTAVTVGSSFVIRGTVTDQCVGAKAIADEQGFTDGVPAVSDESMSAWMEYLYEQQAKPTNATGVPVSIDVIDSNGNYRNIGSTTSDSSGTFAFTWKPDIPGDFTVIATFEGSASYYPSSVETHFTASEAAPTASPYPVTALPPTEMYFAISTVAIIIAIAIATILMLRKRP